MCAFGLKSGHPPWAGEGVLLLGLDLAPESCAGEKCSPSGRTGGSSGLPERGVRTLWCREGSQPWMQAGWKPVTGGDEAGHKVLIPHHLSYTRCLQAPR